MSANTTPDNYQPHLALQIGVTGHRDLGLDAAGEAALQASISQLLQTIANAYQVLAGSETATQLLGKQKPLPPRLLSPLAAGADSLAAQAALANHYELHSPLPFPRKVYAEDFSEQTLPIFDGLLAQASRVLELDGVKARSNDAYRYVGQFVLRHSDILLAVWDGLPNDNTPGTAGVVAAALRMDLPVLWVRPDAPSEVKYHDPRQSETWQVWDAKQLADLLAWRLLPPVNPDNAKPRKLQRWQTFWKIEKHCCQVYFKHPAPRRNLRGTVFRTLFAWFGKGTFKGMIGNPYRQDADFQWQYLLSAAEGILPISETVGTQFIHADSIASYYADRYRGTFVSTFALGGLAVLFALLGAPFEGAGHDSGVYAISELVTIGIVAYLIAKGRLCELHQRWVDFRLLAERLRQYAFLAPVGGVSQASLPIFHSHDDHSYELVNWLVRTITRAEGIPPVSFDAQYRETYRAFMLAMIKDQADYHTKNHHRNHRIAHVLHNLNTLLLVFIVSACGLHIVWHEPFVAVLSTIIAAVLPAFGAAVFGVLSQGEFERIAKRSKGMAKHLNKIISNINQNPDADVLELTQQAQLAIDTMSQELYDWRVIFRAKPLEQHA